MAVLAQTCAGTRTRCHSPQTFAASHRGSRFWWCVSLNNHLIYILLGNFIEFWRSAGELSLPAQGIVIHRDTKIYALTALCLDDVIRRFFEFSRCQYHEENLPAVGGAAQANPRLFGAHAHPRWPRDHTRAPGQGTRPAGCLTSSARQSPVRISSASVGEADLSKLYRMRLSDEFSAVLGRRQTMRGGHVVMYYAPNGRVVARLGLIVGRKADRRAVGRNLFKRIVREAFRAVRMELPPFDVVMRPLAQLRNIKRSELRSDVDNLLSRLAH